MKYRTGEAFRRALEDRLKAESRRSGLDFQWLCRLVAFERLLARLVVVAPERWILKGGLALDLRLNHRARATRDVDLVRHDDENIAEADFRAARQLDADDYVAFAIERTRRLEGADVGGAIEYLAHCDIAGRRFASFHVDVGFGTPVLATPDRLSGPDFLSFADIPTIEVPCIRVAQHIAEKVHAYSRTYGSQAERSSRVKDLIDLVLIQANTSVPSGELRAAIVGVFAVRGTHDVPAALPPPPAPWRRPYRDLAARLSVPPDRDDGHRLAAALVDPILAGTVGDDASWNPGLGCWVIPAGGA